MGRMLGYRLKDGKLTIMPEEAEIVKRIFTEFLNGSSISGIAKGLNRDQVPAIYTDVWHRNTIARILANEKYTGNMLLQKTYRPDFRAKKDFLNKGQVKMYEVTDSHEAIINKEDFDLAQQRLQQICTATKAAAKQSKKNNQEDAVSGSHLFSGLIRCGECGHLYGYRFSNTGKYKHAVWYCRQANELGKSACPSKPIPEHILVEQTRQILNIASESKLTSQLIKDSIARITVPAPHRLTYRLTDGTEIEVEWQHKSRRESWTPEMRQIARERALKQHRKEKTE